MGEQHSDVVVVGAGFAGMYLLHRLRLAGLTARVIEAGSDVGGTWYWNRYPGARCDVPSMEYSYSFDNDLQQQWEWTERYSGQPEILSYASHVADRFDLRADITFDTRVVAAVFDESSSTWTVSLDSGEHITSRFFVLATGCLSSANMPNIAGRDTFSGPLLHTGEWPHEPVDFSGQRVAVIGTGSSGIQSIPIIADQAGHLTVFQRTPNYSVPARNQPLDPAEQARTKAEYDTFRAANRLQTGGFGSRTPRGTGSAKADDPQVARSAFEQRWETGGFGFLSGYADLMLDADSNVIAAEFVRERIADIVHDPATAALLSPEQVIGCKRLCLDTNYFETYNRPNVDLVDIKTDPIHHIDEHGLVLTSGARYDADMIVFATGFDAMTGSITKIAITGRDGLTIQDAWSAGPVNYLGLQVVGFPNMFTITGPGSPSVLTNMIVSIEQHVDWITDAMVALGEGGYTAIEATEGAQSDWVGHVNTVADFTLFPTCNSWYLGANIAGKTRVFMPLIGFPDYAARCDAVAAAGYEGFALS